MTEIERKFKNQHDKFNSLNVKTRYDAEIMRKKYSKDELICHALLSEECFYFLDKKGVEDALRYVRHIYPNTTEEEMMKVFDEKREIVYEIYG